MTVKEAVEKVVDLANSQVGYEAAKGKINKYAAYLDTIPSFYNGKKNGFDWCDCFTDYIYVKSFGPETGRKMIHQPLKSLGAGVGYSANYYKVAGAFKSLPEIGSQIFFGNAHTGIVVDIVGDYITTVEGNVGGGDGMVLRKTYLKNDRSITGYGIPNWGLVAKGGTNEQINTSKVKKAIEGVSTEIAKKAWETYQGKYGNGAARVKALGDYYTPVQWVINYVLKED